MPVIKKSTAPPPEPPKKRNSGIAGAKGEYKSKIKKDPAARRRPILSPIYGEEVLEPLIKKEKEIVVCFYPFTKNDLRISTDGKFIIEKNLSKQIPEMRWNLYYFPEPISDFTPPDEIPKFQETIYEIDLVKCVRFDDISELKNLEDKVIEIVRAEYFNNRQEKLEELKEQDRIFKEELERLRELEESENELAEEVSGEFENISESETGNESSEGTESTEVFSETSEEERNLSNETKED